MGRSRAIVSSYVGVLVFAGFIFLAAGRLAYWQALLYVGLALVGTTLSHLLLPGGSALAVERAARAGAGEAWDKKLRLSTTFHPETPNDQVEAVSCQV